MRVTTGSAGWACRLHKPIGQRLSPGMPKREPLISSHPAGSAQLTCMQQEGWCFGGAPNGCTNHDCRFVPDIPASSAAGGGHGTSRQQACEPVRQAHMVTWGVWESVSEWCASPHTYKHQGADMTRQPSAQLVRGLRPECSSGGMLGELTGLLQPGSGCSMTDLH
jgi:hypothetical protein